MRRRVNGIFIPLSVYSRAGHKHSQFFIRHENSSDAGYLSPLTRAFFNWTKRPGRFILRAQDLYPFYCPWPVAEEREDTCALMWAKNIALYEKKYFLRPRHLDDRSRRETMDAPLVMIKFLCVCTPEERRVLYERLQKGCFCVFCEIRNIGDWNDGVVCWRVYGDVKICLCGLLGKMDWKVVLLDFFCKYKNFQ